LRPSRLLSYFDNVGGLLFRRVLFHISPVLLAQYRSLLLKGTLPNLKDPRTFDEKLLWLNFYWRHPLKTTCGDKYTMRSYVQEHGLSHILPRLWGVYEHSEEIDFDVLPNNFVLKCTHGCGFNIFCRNKGLLDVRDAKKRLNKWMRQDITRRQAELHYRAMKPRIICEEFLVDSTSELPVDYKVFCFSGKAHCTMACSGRTANARAARYIYYDLEWKNRLPYQNDTAMDTAEVAKPDAYDEIIRASELLSEPFPFVRMDFYSIKGKAVLGEMTFTPDGCIDEELSELAQRLLGAMITLPEPLQ